MLGDADKDPAIEPNASQAKLFLLNQVYLCEKLSLVNEMYFALTLDPKAGDPVPIDVFTGSANEDALKVIDGGLALKAAAVDQMKKLYNLSSQSDYSLLKADNSLVYRQMNALPALARLPALSMTEDFELLSCSGWFTDGIFFLMAAFYGFLLSPGTW